MYSEFEEPQPMPESEATQWHRWNGLTEHVWIEPIPDYVAVYEYRILMAIGKVVGHAKLATRWHMPDSRVRKLIKVAKGELPERYWQRTSSRVYFLSDGELIKIGFSERPEFRKEDLEKEVGLPLTLIGTLPGGAMLESRLHRRFSDFRVRGEWFSITEDMARQTIEEGLRWL